jgi:hypothetical protein
MPEHPGIFYSNQAAENMRPANGLHPELELDVLRSADTLAPQAARIAHARNTSLTKDGDPSHSALSDEAREQITNLVQRVFLFPKSGAPRHVVFSNVDDGPGSRELCLYAGQLLASQISGSLCLVDATLGASSSGSGELKKRIPDGFSTARAAKDFAVRTADANLWLLPAESLGLEGTAKLPSAPTRARVAELKQEFDYVLINAPPLTRSATAALLGQMADGLILIVEAHSTRRETARAAKATLDRAGVKLLGAILNNHISSIPRALRRKL